MIGSIILLAEKISELSKHRAERRARWFKEIVDPTFKGMKICHKDYLEMFEVVKLKVRNDVPSAEIYQYISMRRVAEETERRTIINLCWELSKDKSIDKCSTFFKVSTRYFGAGPLDTGTIATIFMQKLSEITSETTVLSEQEESEKTSLINLADYSLTQLRKNWGEVSMEHTKAMARSIFY